MLSDAAHLDLLSAGLHVEAWHGIRDGLPVVQIDGPSEEFLDHGNPLLRVYLNDALIYDGTDQAKLSDEEGTLNVEGLRDLAQNENEIAELLGIHDDMEQAGADYTEALVKLTDAYLKKVKSL